MAIFRCLIICFAVCGVAIQPAVAGYCEYMLYSEYMGRSIRVCQTAATVEECGAWPGAPQTDRVMAFAEGKAQDLLELEAGECTMDRAVGTCLFGSGTLVFYEGNVDILEVGCSKMQGIWQPVTTP